MTNTHIARIAYTCGEPAGIGPDLAILLAQSDHPAQIVVIGSKTLLLERAKALQLDINIIPFNDAQRRASKAQEICLYDVALNTDCIIGQLDPDNASYVLKTLDIATIGCIENQFDAMLTGPLHKGVINDAGIAFTGHTEYLAKLCNRDPVMMLATESLRVALATTHLPLKDIAASITDTLLEKVILILHKDLEQFFGIHNPTILVCGLNPHAGEGGHLGNEEIQIISPVLERMREQGMKLIGPLPADTLFTPKYLDNADAVLAMYHDQGLPVLKYSGFGKAVNITLGLSIIRTSVDHGTAIELAGTGNINIGSLNSALALAINLVKSKTS